MAIVAFGVSCQVPVMTSFFSPGKATLVELFPSCMALCGAFESCRNTYLYVTAAERLQP